MAIDESGDFVDGDGRRGKFDDGCVERGFSDGDGGGAFGFEYGLRGVGGRGSAGDQECAERGDLDVYTSDDGIVESRGDEDRGGPDDGDDGLCDVFGIFGIHGRHCGRAHFQDDDGGDFVVEHRRGFAERAGE